MKLELTAPVHFGLESVLKREIYDLGYDVTDVTDGRVTFAGDEEACVRANIFIGSAERILIKVGEFKAVSWEEFFDKIYGLPWERYIPLNGRFWVKKASSVKSALFSSRDIQSLAKKAMVKRLSSVYDTASFPDGRFPEDGADYPVRIFINKDQVFVGLDTSGESLHKRGYRVKSGTAPISETMAYGIIKLSPFGRGRILVDPFCGSGTIPIEAARIAANIPPGIDRNFLAETWKNLIPEKLWDEIRREGREGIDTLTDTDIQGYDIDPFVIAVAKENAVDAGVDELVHFQARDVSDLSHRKKYGFIITNPPYGERISGLNELPGLYRALGEGYRRLEDWSMYVISSWEDAPDYIGGRPDKNRKLYNGMIKTYLYQYLGAKPPGKKK